jgi:hypothetical protein
LVLAIGEDRFHSPSFIAAFLSLRLAEPQVNASTLSDIVIETPDANDFSAFYRHWL